MRPTRGKRIAKELAGPDQAEQARDRSRPRQSDKIATIVAEPLERGFGMTLGNALRRVLLSSLQGAAITTVHIDGVLHEFSSIPGVREDVTNIILNIKEIALRDALRRRQAHGAEEGGPRRRSRPPTSRRAREIEILNPEHVICTLDQGAAIRMEFTAAWARAMCPPSATAPTTRRSA